MQRIEQIYEQDFKTVYKYLLCLTHNEDIAEELTQETFYRAIKSIKTFKGNCKMSVWLCKIAKNLWYNELKKGTKMVELDENEWLHIETNDKVEDTVICNNERVELYNKLQKLDKQTRTVMYLRITEELSFREIADKLNKTEIWARTVFFRGKKKLKEEKLYERKKGL